MTRVGIVGATGLIGRHLSAALTARGDEVVAFSRTAPPPAVRWDPASQPLPADEQRRLDAIVNLAGEPIGPARWTAARQRQILESRLSATRAVAAAIGDGPGLLVNASGVGVYGPTEAPVDESSPPGFDFLARVCTEWEAAAMAASDRGRVVVLRTGVVLANDGGAFPLLARLGRFGLLGRVGDGRQWLPWIHIDDEVRAILHCLDDEALGGPVNLVAPNPVRQAEFASSLGALVRRPLQLPAPAAAVRALLGDAAALLLDGAQVRPRVLLDAGFAWTAPVLPDALASLLAR